MALFNVGDKIILNELKCAPSMFNAFKGAVGTITQVIATREKPYYIINWDRETSHTYRTRDNPNQFNISAYKTILYKQVDKKELICNKIRYLQKKFNERKLIHDF